LTADASSSLSIRVPVIWRAISLDSNTPAIDVGVNNSDSMKQNGSRSSHRPKHRCEPGRRR
jgi:hypothetical protein